MPFHPTGRRGAHTPSPCRPRFQRVFPRKGACQAPTTAPAQAPTDNDLANTGASSSMLMLGVAGGVLLLGGVVFLLLRRRNSAN